MYDHSPFGKKGGNTILKRQNRWKQTENCLQNHFQIYLLLNQGKQSMPNNSEHVKLTWQNYQSPMNSFEQAKRPMARRERT